MFLTLKKERNIFSRLYRYRPKLKQTPRENFIREAFVLVLSCDENMLKRFIKKYMKFEMLGKLNIDSHVSYKDAFFDIVIDDNEEFYIIIECKMGAEISPQKDSKDDNDDQIDKYANFLTTMNFKNKGILYISQKEPIKREYPSIVFNSIRWKGVKDFLEKEKLEDNISDFLRIQFIEFLTSHNVDRTIKDGKLLWKCKICDNCETRGMGIRAHKEKHCRELSYIILNENEKLIKEFEQTLKPHKLAIEKTVNEIKTLNKIEMRNYEDSLKIIEILNKNILPEFWLYTLAEKIKFIFSNKAYYKFYMEIEDKLNKIGIKSITSPRLADCSYENILKYKEQYLK